MGEAKRRGSHRPSAAERFVRWMNRLWLMYPTPIRSFSRVNAQIVLGFTLLLVALVVVGVAAAWLTHR